MSSNIPVMSVGRGGGGTFGWSLKIIHIENVKDRFSPINKQETFTFRVILPQFSPMELQWMFLP